MYVSESTTLGNEVNRLLCEPSKIKLPPRTIVLGLVPLKIESIVVTLEVSKLVRSNISSDDISANIYDMSVRLDVLNELSSTAFRFEQPRNISAAEVRPDVSRQSMLMFVREVQLRNIPVALLTAKFGGREMDSRYVQPLNISVAESTSPITSPIQLTSFATKPDRSMAVSSPQFANMLSTPETKQEEGMVTDSKIKQFSKQATISTGAGVVRPDRSTEPSTLQLENISFMEEALKLEGSVTVLKLEHDEKSPSISAAPEVNRPPRLADASPVHSRNILVMSETSKPVGTVIPVSAEHL